MTLSTFARQLISTASNILRPLPRLHHLARSSYHDFLSKQWERAQSELRSFCASATRQEARPFFVKVGANDGVTGDPIGNFLIANQKWKGLLIEPVDYCFRKLQHNYNDVDRFTLLPVAVGNGPAVATFYYVDDAAKRDLPTLPDWYDQLGSFSRQHILNHLDGILQSYIREQEVRVERLADILDRQGVTSVTLLHIDTEGEDLRVLESLNFNRVRPRGILIEHKHLSPEDKHQLRVILRDEGYKVFDCGSDFFARS